MFHFLVKPLSQRKTSVDHLFADLLISITNSHRFYKLCHDDPVADLALPFNHRYLFIYCLQNAKILPERRHAKPFVALFIPPIPKPVCHLLQKLFLKGLLTWGYRLRASSQRQLQHNYTWLYKTRGRLFSHGYTFSSLAQEICMNGARHLRVM